MLALIYQTLAFDVFFFFAFDVLFNDQLISDSIFHSIPGGHFMHPLAPLVEELENVPRGHGNNVATTGLLSAILLNPDAR